MSGGQFMKIKFYFWSWHDHDMQCQHETKLMIIINDDVFRMANIKETTIYFCMKCFFQKHLKNANATAKLAKTLQTSATQKQFSNAFLSTRSSEFEWKNCIYL